MKDHVFIFSNYLLRYLLWITKGKRVTLQRKRPGTHHLCTEWAQQQGDTWKLARHKRQAQHHFSDSTSEVIRLNPITRKRQTEPSQGTFHEVSGLGQEVPRRRKTKKVEGLVQTSETKETRTSKMQHVTCFIFSRQGSGLGGGGVAPCGLWDPSVLTGDWNLALAVKVLSSNPWTTREFPTPQQGARFQLDLLL